MSNTTILPAWAAGLKNPPAYKQKQPGIPDPPGYGQPSSGSSKVNRPLILQCRPNNADTPQKKDKDAKRQQPTADEMDTLKVKKAWEVALGPIKGLPMTLLMIYMTPNSLQIFSIMMVFMTFKNPIMGILGTNQAFHRFETDTNRSRILQVKVAYVAFQLVALALGIWKVNAMGLLP